MRPRDEHAESALERIGGDPCFMWARRVPAARDHGGFDALAAGTGNTLDVDKSSEHANHDLHAGYFDIPVFVHLWSPFSGNKPFILQSLTRRPKVATPFRFQHQQVALVDVRPR
jgi:hypothetical protein